MIRFVVGNAVIAEVRGAPLPTDGKWTYAPSVYQVRHASNGAVLAYANTQAEAERVVDALKLLELALELEKEP